VVTVGVVLAGCSGAPAGDEAAADTLVVALSDEPDNLNPIFGDLYGSIYGDHWPIFSSLLDYGQDVELQPDLATGMPEVSPDGRTVTVPLRDGVQWHDGEPFTADDVVFTYGAFLDPAVATGLRDELYDSLESVRALDEATVEFRLSRMDPAFPDKLTLGIVPEHVLAGQDLNTTPFNTAPIGTGPYRFEELRGGERMVLSANSDYYGGDVGISRLVYSFVPDENARASALRAGEIDVDAVGLPPRTAEETAATDGLELVRIPGEATVLLLPQQNPLFADPVVRDAVGLAVDRQAIAEGVFAGAARPIATPIPAGSWAASGIETSARDVEQARSLLDQAGWVAGPDGARARGGVPFAFPLTYSAGSATANNTALALRDQLAEVGVDVTLEGLGFDAQSDRLGAGTATLNTQGEAYDPGLTLFRAYHSSFIADGEPFTDATQLNDPAVDSALEQARATLDRDQRAAAYADLEKALVADGSFLYLVRGENSLVVSDRIQGVQPKVREAHIHGFSRGLLWNVHEWTLADAG